MAFKKTLTSLVLAGALALGLAGCKQKVEKPNPDDFKNGQALVYSQKGKFVLMDFDGDKNVDVIATAPNSTLSRVLYYAPGYEKEIDEYGLLMYDSRKMPQSIRDSASRVLESNYDLNFQMADRDYQESIGCIEE